MKAFVAYSAEPAFLSTTIEEATARVASLRRADDFATWRQLDIPGRFIADEVLEAIDNAECLVGKRPVRAIFRDAA